MASLIKANHININYRLDGPEDGPVVMLSNSLMSNYTMWDDQVAALTSRFRVLRYDQRGHGGTQVTPGPYTVELLTEDALALMEVLGIASVHFVGLSMGGFTGQLMAATYPGKVLSLALCDTACVMPPESLWNERIEAARNNGIKSLVGGTLERWFTPDFHETGRDELERVRAMIMGTSVEGYCGCAEAIRDMSLCGNLPAIKVPTLVLVGEADPACPPAAAEVLHRGIVNSYMVTIPGAAHLPNIEQTSLFNEALLKFLNEQK